MKVVLLCGGIGKRMLPITEDKFLLNFVGKTLLEHQIEMAVEVGLTEFVIVGNPQNISRIEEITANIPGIEANLVIQQEPLGIADALESARRLLGGEIIVVNPNEIFDISAYALLFESSHSEPATSYLLGCEVKEYFPDGYLVADEDGELKQIVEKAERGKEPSNLVNMLIHLHRDPATLLKYIASIQTSGDDAYEQAIATMANNAYRIKVIPYSGRWDAIKYPWHILTTVRQFLNQKLIAPSAYISSKATVTGQVVISDNVKVLENAVIRGPAYIGPNTIIGNNCLVRDYSHIGANCVIGYSTEVKGSYIGDRCWFHMSYIGDSVIGDGCLFGAGTVLANFRFDEANISVRIGDELIDTNLDKFGAIIGNNSKLGVNTSVMPGVRIGPNSTVGSHVCLTEDLEPDTMILAQPAYKTIKNRLQTDEKREQKAGQRMENLRVTE